MTQTLHLHGDDRHDDSRSRRHHEAPSAHAAMELGGPSVIVRRKRAFVQVGNDPTAIVESQPRAPRVFRVAAAGERAGGDDSAKAGGPSPVESTPSDAMLARPVRRRRAKAAPVTIIRPDAGPNSRPRQESHGAPAADAAGAAIGLRFGQSMEDHQRYLQIQRKIELLRLEARILRQTEVAAAVAWIRKAIAEHDIDIRELGL